MEHKQFCIYDEKAEAYITPFYAPTVAVAKRNFTQAATTEGNSFNLFAADYTLFETGTWDDQTAIGTNARAPINHGTALQHRAIAARIQQETQTFQVTEKDNTDGNL